MLALLHAALLAANFNVELLVTREIKGAHYPVDSNGKQCTTAPASVYADCTCYGGAARRRQYVGSGSESAGANVVSLDTGSFYCGSGLFHPAFSGGSAAQKAYAAEMLAAASPEAYGLTYRDFSGDGLKGVDGASGGADGLREYIEEARALEAALPKAVVSNLNVTGETTLSGVVEMYTNVALGSSKRLAVLSLTDPTHLTATLPAYAARLEDYWRALAVQLSVLRRLASPPHVIVAMVPSMPVSAAQIAAAGGSRAQAEANALLKLVDEAIGVDVYIIGEFPAITSVSTRTNWAGDKVLIVPARGTLSNGGAIDRVSATFDDDGLLLSGSATIDQLTCTDTVHTATQSRIATLHGEMTTLLSGSLGKSLAHALDSSPTAAAMTTEAYGCTSMPISGSSNTNDVCGCRVSSCAQGAFVADALRLYASSDAAIVNGGAIDATVSAGALTKLSVVEMLPYTNEVVRLFVTGATLKQALQNGISQLGLSDAATNPDGRFLQVSSTLTYSWHYEGSTPTLNRALIAGVAVNDTRVYTIATNAFVGNGGDDFTMFATSGLPADGVTIENLGVTDVDAVVAYVASFSGSSVSVTWDRITQEPNRIVLQVGSYCKTYEYDHPSGNTATIDQSSREECDHVKLLADLINDKADGFMDDLLPYGVIQIAESNAGCVEGKMAAATAELQAALPNMLALVGPGCSNDVMDVSSVANRAALNADQVLVSGSSTAPALTDEAAYPNVARLATGEASGGGPGNAIVAKYYGWKRVAILADDSAWGMGAVGAFISAFKAFGEEYEIINENDKETAEFSLSAMDADTIKAEDLLNKLAGMGTRIVYMATQPRAQRKFFAASFTSGVLSGKGFAWILGWVDEAFVLTPEGAVDPNAVRGAEGAIGLLESVGEDTELHQQFRTKWLAASSIAGCSTKTPYCDVDGSPTNLPSGYAMGYAEALMLVAKAMNTTGSYVDSNGARDDTLPNYRSESFRSDPISIYAAMKALGQVGYDSISGRVVLDENGDRLGSFNVQNMQIITGRRLASDSEGEEEEAEALAFEWKRVPPRFQTAPTPGGVSRRKLAVPLSTSSATFEVIATWAPGQSEPDFSAASKSVIFPGGTTEVPSDRDTGGMIVAIVVPIVGVLIFIFVGVFFWQRHVNRKAIGRLKKELEKFKDSLLGMYAISEDFDPRGERTRERMSASNGPRDAAEIERRLRSELGHLNEPRSTDELAKVVAREVGIEVRPGATSEQVLREAYGVVLGAGALGGAAGSSSSSAEEEAGSHAMNARWFWKEDDANIPKHNPVDVKDFAGGKFVSYSGSVCMEINQGYAAWQGGGPGEIVVDLADRIGSTGTEQKAHDPNKSGVVFKINFERMVQLNAKTGFERQVVRDGPAAAKKSSVRVQAAPPRASEGAAAARLSRSKSKWQSGKGKLGSVEAMAKGAGSRTKPAELADEDGLILHVGQLVKTSKQLSNGWAFGSVVYDPMDSRPPISVEGVSTQAGWFPLSCTTMPSAEQLQTLQKMMGGGDGASDALKPPRAWSEMKGDPMVPENITLPEGPEKQKVVAAFMKTLTSNVKVVSVQRVQNMSMWQSYAVKRQTVLMREKEASDAPSSRFERVWLFHGTDQDTVPKITSMGFNRSFCGKNATMFGKGVYFARDASYSSSTTYSRPNGQGIQHMFLVRVVVGVYCQGVRDALTPDVRQGHQLYDTTVNDTRSPGIFVTYHDAQAYPEYLVRFKQ